MVKIGLIGVLFLGLACLAVLNMHRLGGQYILRDADHAEVMVAEPASPPNRIVRVLFVGNSFTFTNDLPAMLANLAASDPGNRTRLEVKAVTYPNAHLDYLMAKTDALTLAREHHVDYVVLQEHSGWYESAEGITAAGEDVSTWVNVLRSLNETPLLFETWPDGIGSDVYTNQSYTTFGSNPDEASAKAVERTRDLARQAGLTVVPVGTAFARARHIQGAPELLGLDHHHPSVAGTYLAALVFYRTFTGRTGAEVSYRPWGMGKSTAEFLSQIAAE